MEKFNLVIDLTLLTLLLRGAFYTLRILLLTIGQLSITNTFVSTLHTITKHELIVPSCRTHCADSYNYGRSR